MNDSAVRLGEGILSYTDAICYSSFAYFALLVIIYLKWSAEDVKVLKNLRRAANNVRYPLLVVLVTTHLVEFGEYCTMTLSAVEGTELNLAAAVLQDFSAQYFYHKMERNGEAGIFGFTAFFWILVAICHIWKFVRFPADLALVVFCNSILATAASISLAGVDLFFAWKEIRAKNVDFASEEKPGAYRYGECRWYSKITFYWLTPLMMDLGHVKNLTAGYLGWLPLSETAANVQRRFQNIRNDNGSLWACYWRTHWLEIAMGGILKLCGDVAALVPALGIAGIVKCVEKTNLSDFPIPEISPATFDVYFSNGYVVAAAVLLSIVIQGSFSQMATHLMNKSGIRLKNSLQAAIYSKLLHCRKRWTKSADEEGNRSHLSNLMGEDTYNVMSCFWIIHYAWAIPLKIALIVCLLYRELGISAVIGAVLSIIIMIPAQFYIGKLMAVNGKVTSECTDKRLRKINEILQGIRYIKLNSCEREFAEEINELRRKELFHLNRDSLYWTIITFLTNASSIVIATITLASFYALDDKGEGLSAGALFTSLALFNQLTVPLFIFPIMVPIFISTIVSTNRIEKFLNCPEIPNENSAHDSPADEGSSSTSKIPENSEMVRENIVMALDHFEASGSNIIAESLVIKKGTLNAVVGETGCGKSTFLSALLGELQHTGGLFRKPGIRLGYVSQTPWLMNATFRDNVIFGSVYSDRTFKRVISVCCLKDEVEFFTDKEFTVVGDRGVNLSGGQKQRVAIARALYCDPDLIIMDDPFSALSEKVADHILEKGVMAAVNKGKTVVIACNCEKILSRAHQVISMKDGKVKIVENSPLLSGNSGTSDLIYRKETNETGLSENDRFCTSDIQCRDQPEGHCSGPISFIPLKRRPSTFSGSRYLTHDLPLPTDDCEGDVFEATPKLDTRRGRHRAATLTECVDRTFCSNHHADLFRATSLQTSPTLGKFKQLYSSYDNLTGVKLNCEDLRDWRKRSSKLKLMRLQSAASAVEEEIVSDQEINSVENLILEGIGKNKNASAFKIYASYAGLFPITVYILSNFGWQIWKVAADFWIGCNLKEGNKNIGNISQILFEYVAFSMAALAFSLASTCVGQYMGTKCRQLLHENMTRNLLRAPVQFFDVTSLGHIISRFSTDTDIVDKKIATSAQRLIQFQLLCVLAIFVNCILTPWFLIFILPISLIYYMVQKFYRQASRNLQQLDIALRDSIQSYVLESYHGLEVIRAFGQCERFSKTLHRKMDRHTNALLILISANQWLGIFLDYLSGLVVFAAMMVSLLKCSMDADGVPPIFAGFAINYTLLAPIYLNWVVKFTADVELFMEAARRVHEYAVMPCENYDGNIVENAILSPASNAGKGAFIVFADVTLRYAPEEAAIVRNFSLEIPSGQKVGICGRTGSGKSTLVMSIFNMVPYIEGDIIVDGLAVKASPLELLRSRIAIIPQDIMLFNGTIRRNLDWKKKYSDEEMWDVLKMVRMDKCISGIGGLDAEVEDGGSNFSAGERQLICLARAILLNSHCLILDESTSSLLSETERDFFQLAQTLFQASTLIVVTHRVSNLLDFDRVIVLENGRLVEDGDPKSLVMQPRSKFSSLIKQNVN